DRAKLLAWLRGFSGARSDLPPAEPTSTLAEYGLDPRLLAIEGDPEYGAYLAGECTTCHRPGGGEAGIPSITGWPHDDFVIALHAYRRGKRVHPAMQLVAGRLSDEEIAALAAHFHRAQDGP
ncbi:MAG: c-type cytochrome, partial [Alphaproteobacteria bacterium]|nr:c-type cytochrome [Alphaproteobacteria bacterium]